MRKYFRKKTAICRYKIKVAEEGSKIIYAEQLNTDENIVLMLANKDEIENYVEIYRKANRCKHICKYLTLQTQNSLSVCLLGFVKF